MRTFLRHENFYETWGFFNVFWKTFVGLFFWNLNLFERKNQSFFCDFELIKIDKFYVLRNKYEKCSSHIDLNQMECIDRYIVIINVEMLKLKRKQLLDIKQSIFLGISILEKSKNFEKFWMWRIFQN